MQIGYRVFFGTSAVWAWYWLEIELSRIGGWNLILAWMLDTINSATHYNVMPPPSAKLCRHPKQRYSASELGAGRGSQTHHPRRRRARKFVVAQNPGLAGSSSLKGDSEPKAANTGLRITHAQRSHLDERIHLPSLCLQT